MANPFFAKNVMVTTGILKKRVSKHYAHNHFFGKTGLATFFKNIKSGHFINVQLSKNFLESQTTFLQFINNYLLRY